MTGVNGLGSRQQKIYISCNNMQSALRIQASGVGRHSTVFVGMASFLTLLFPAPFCFGLVQHK